MSENNNAEIKSENQSEIKSEDTSTKSKGQRIGSKYQVFEGIAKQTAGGLTKDDLMKNKRGQIISKKRHEQGHKAFENLKKHVLAKHNSSNEEPKEDQAGDSEELSTLDENKETKEDLNQANESALEQVEQPIKEEAPASIGPAVNNAIIEPPIIESSKGKARRALGKKAAKQAGI